MALPASVATVTVTGTYTNWQGAPCTGSVTITPVCTCALVDTADGVFIAGGVSVALDADGSFSVDLVASQQASVDPYDFCYRVTEEVSCLGCPRTYTIAVPADMGALDLSDVLNTG